MQQDISITAHTGRPASSESSYSCKNMQASDYQEIQLGIPSEQHLMNHRSLHGQSTIDELPAEKINKIQLDIY